MKNIKVSTKLIILVAVMSLIIGMIGIYGERNLKITNDSVQTVYKESVIPIMELNAIKDKYAVSIVDAVIKMSTGNMDWETGKRNIRKASEEIDVNWGTYSSTYMSSEEKGLANEVKQEMENADESIGSLLQIIEHRDITGLKNYLDKQLYAVIDPATAKIAELINLQVKVAENEYNRSNLIYLQARNNAYVFIISAITAALLIAFVIVKNITGIVAKLRELIAFVQVAADNISSASNQMNSSSQQVAGGATEQAASAEQVSASMEEITSSIQQNADNALQAEKIAVKVAQDVVEGNQAVNKTVDSMKEIADRISVVGDIARQTNLLALNAAVEAARAGDYGRGFAVVAAEVRKLAERSQAAALEINNLSKTGVTIAEKSAGLLQEIVPEMQKTSRLVQEISLSSAEQNTGAREVNKALQELNQVIQQNAAASEEMAAGSEELSSQAGQLKDIINFDIGNDIKAVTKTITAPKQASRHSNPVIKRLNGERKNSSSRKHGININMEDKDQLDEKYERF